MAILLIKRYREWRTKNDKLSDKKGNVEKQKGGNKGEGDKVQHIEKKR